VGEGKEGNEEGKEGDGDRRMGKSWKGKNCNMRGMGVIVKNSGTFFMAHGVEWRRNTGPLAIVRRNVATLILVHNFAKR